MGAPDLTPGEAYLVEAGPGHRARRVGLVALGSGAAGAAVMGVLVLGGAPADIPNPDRRAPSTSVNSPAPPVTVGPSRRTHRSLSRRRSPPTGHNGWVTDQPTGPTEPEPTLPLSAMPRLGPRPTWTPPSTERLPVGLTPVAPEPRGRSRGWFWPVAACLALLLGVVGGVAGSALYDRVDDSSTAVLRPGPGGHRRGRHRLRAAPRGRRGHDRQRGRGAAAEHGADLRRVRRRGGRRHRLRLRPRRAGPRDHQQPRRRAGRRGRRPDRDRRPGRQQVRRHGGRPQPGLRPRGPLLRGRQGPAARLAGRLEGAADRRGRRRTRLAAGPQLHRHRRHRQCARPAGDHGRRRRGGPVLLHQRGPDRRRHQPGQLRWPAGQPARPGRRRELRDRDGRRRHRRGVRQHRRRVRDPDRAGPDHRRPDPRAPARRATP